MHRITIRAMFAPLLLAAAATLAAEPSPYAGDVSRTIKSLSPDEVDGYLAGGGMGFARAAELNGYPGPRHVLDLAGPLELDDAQRARTQALFDAMQARASALGADLVARERELDRLFAGGTIDARSLERLVAEIGALQAQIRLAHLATHLEQKAILTPHQVMTYDRLRGYGGGGHAHGHAHGG